MRKNIIKTLAMVTVVGTLLGTTGLTAFAAETAGITLTWED
ncbi:hypothetical protein [Pseudobutyrivibrio xylanivorans]|nr:hypothetical protein [Pseudobutyrivibrio xylanivorans]